MLSLPRITSIRLYSFTIGLKLMTSDYRWDCSLPGPRRLGRAPEATTDAPCASGAQPVASLGACNMSDRRDGDLTQHARERKIKQIEKEIARLTAELERIDAELARPWPFRRAA